MLVPDFTGGAVGDVARRLLALGVPAGALVIDPGCGTGRYAVKSRHERSATAPGRSLAFTSDTVLDHDRRRMLVRERYTGVVDGASIDERHDFAMRPWTADELRAHALGAGFADAELHLGAAGGVAPDRLQVVAHR